VDNARHKPTRAQWLKIADKTSNLRGIRDSPPSEWTLDRCREYVAWARRVVSAFPDPHPALLAQFEQVAEELETRLGCAPHASADV
jgi:guanosine-3',5'-bis(diphosphate) 3'-pyrophosphohydrolase